MLSPESFARSQRRHATDVVRVALEGRGILGFIDVHERMTLLEARQLIWDNVEHAPADFQFVLDDGVPVSARQESTQLILHFYPCVKLREAKKATSVAQPVAADVAPPSTTGQSQRLSVWTAAGDEFSVWVSEEYTFQQLRRDAARYWNLPASQVALVDGDGCLWPEQARILAVMDAETLQQRRIVLDSKGGSGVVQSSTPTRRRSADSNSMRTASPRHRTASTTSSSTSVGGAPLRLLPDNPLDDLWRVFTFYCAAGDSLEVESLTHHQFSRLLRDAHVPPAVAGIIYVAETKRPGKMTFDEFLNALLKVAKRSSARAGADSDDALLERLVLEHVLPRASRWPATVWDQQTLALRTPDIIACTARFLEPLLDLFYFYAKSHVLSTTSSSNSSNTATTVATKQFYLAYADFQRFVNDFAFANLQISSVECAQVYLAACASPPVHDALAMPDEGGVDNSGGGTDEDDAASATSSTPSPSSTLAAFQRVAATADGVVLFASAASQVGRCCMSFSAFLDALGRLGLVAFAKSRAAQPLPAVKAVFHHLSRGLGRSRVLEIVKNHGSTSMHAGRLYAGSVAFTHRFLDMWRYEGSPDYLSPSIGTSRTLGSPPPLSVRSPRHQTPLSPSKRLPSSAALFDERVVPNGAGRGREALDRLVRDAFIRNASKVDALGPASPTVLTATTTGGGGDDERALFESILVKGGVFKKYGQWGHPHRRMVWCSPELDALFWRPVDHKKQQSAAKGGVPVATLVAVLPGGSPKTRYAFMKHLSDEKALGRCFSIVAEDKRVDLEADSETTRDLWMQAITFLIKRGLTN